MTGIDTSTDSENLRRDCKAEIGNNTTRKLISSTISHFIKEKDYVYSSKEKETPGKTSKPLIKH